MRRLVRLPRGRPAVCLTQTKSQVPLFPGCRRAAFSKWKSADVRAGSTTFYSWAPDVDLSRTHAALPSGITTAVARPTDSISWKICLGALPRRALAREGPMPNGKSQPVSRYVVVRDELVCISLRARHSSASLTEDMPTSERPQPDESRDYSYCSGLLQWIIVKLCKFNPPQHKAAHRDNAIERRPERARHSRVYHVI